MELELIQELSWLEFTGTALLVTIVFEAITILLRFGFNLQANSDLAFLSSWTGGLRIHHLKFGVLLCVIAFTTGIAPQWYNALMIVGCALIGSDVTHHFLVLWPLTGSHEFNLTYPDS
jgi:hypothetical protein